MMTLENGFPNMVDNDLQQTLHSAVHRYLSTISVVGESLAEACPPVGGPYLHKLRRLRTRLAFNASAEALEGSFQQMSGDLKQYAGQASEHLRRHQTELDGAVETLERLVRALGRRQEFYHARLRILASQLSSTEGANGDAPAQAANLNSLLESLSHETHSLIAEMEETVGAVRRKVAESEITDAVTGLTNRREMERQIEVRKAEGQDTTLILFTVTGPLPDEVAQQVAVRLCAQFRPHDTVARWSPNEFLVLFIGPAEIAEARLGQVTLWMSGRYPVTKSDAVELQVAGKMYEAEMALAE